MERRITEESITKAILSWLESNGWEIICFDFPQSGTGVSLHPNKNIRTTKNKGSIIPDIIAIKKGIVVFFENKDRFVLNDFAKIEHLKLSGEYTESVSAILSNYSYTQIYYGIGLPLSDITYRRTFENKEKIDFAIFVETDGSILIEYQTEAIFI
jgi:hypothetical protein